MRRDEVAVARPQGDEWDDDAQPELAEMKLEMQRVGLLGGLDAYTWSQETNEVVSLASPVVLLPPEFRLQVIKGFGSEVMALGLRHTVEQLRPHGPTILLGESLLSLARALRMYESPGAGLELILQALKVFHDCGSEKRLGRGYLDLGTALKDVGAYYDALHALELASQHCGELGDAGGLAASSYHRAHICRLLGLEYEALLILSETEKHIPDRSQFDSWRKQLLTERVYCELTLGQDDEAMGELDRWVASGDQRSFPFIYRAEIFERRGELKRALDDCCEAARLLFGEILTSNSDRFQRVDRSKYDFVYKRGLRLALQAKEGETALALLESGRTESAGLRRIALRGEESIDRSDDADQDMVNGFRERVSRLVQAAFSAVEKCHVEEMCHINKLAEWLIAESEFLKVPREKYAELHLDLRDVSRSITNALPNGMALLEFFVVDDQVWTLATSNRETTVHQTRLTAFDLALLKESFRYECEGRYPTDALDAVANLLLSPVSESLGSHETLTFALSPEFLGLPFHAMQWQGYPLFETHQTRYVTGGTALVRGRRNELRRPITRSSPCLLLGVPRVPYADVGALPGVREEIEAVQGQFDPIMTRAVMSAGSRDLLAAAKSLTVLHTACHGHFEPSSPLLSRLLLYDRPVFAFEVMLSELGVDLAVLSACRTAEGMMQPGGYTQGLATAFLKAGAKNVVASLWPVDDRAGAIFIERFYHELLNKETDPVSALDRARQHLREQDRFSHPFFWAPFVIYGTP
jgi:CHAT domain-containing protein